MQVYTVTTRNGETHHVNVDRTDAEAKTILAAKPNASAFERDLAGKRRLSPKQTAWLHVLAEWTANPKPRNVGEGEGETFPRILAMLTNAREAGKKFPKIKLRVSAGADYAGSPSRNVVIYLGRNGKANVTDGGVYGRNVWYGAIQLDDTFRAGKDSDSVLPVLRELEKDPLAVAAQHGIATGECCFCARELTTKESRSVGYGPVCADKHGLAWGHVDPTLDREGRGVFNV